MYSANKHGPKDKCEWMHVRTNTGVCTRERGCDVEGEEERTQTTCIHEVSSPHHTHPITTHVNRATPRAVNSDDDTITNTLVYIRLTTTSNTFSHLLRFCEGSPFHMVMGADSTTPCA